MASPTRRRASCRARLTRCFRPQVHTAARISKLLERRAKLTTAELAMHTRCGLCVHGPDAYLALREYSPLTAICTLQAWHCMSWARAKAMDGLSDSLVRASET